MKFGLWSAEEVSILREEMAGPRCYAKRAARRLDRGLDCVKQRAYRLRHEAMPDFVLDDDKDDEDAELATDEPCWEPDEFDDVEDDDQ